MAEHATRPKVKQGLEDRATDYLLAKDMKTLDGLEEVVRFGAQIKEIEQVNANVLLREIGNLRAAMLELADVQRKQLAPAITPENAPKIEEIFVKPPMRVSDLIELMRSSGFEIKKKEGEKGKGVSSNEKGTDNKEELERKSEVEKKEGPADSPKADKSPTLLRKDATYGQASNEVRQESGKDDKSPATIRQAQVESPARPSFVKTTEGEAKKSRFEANIGFKERNEIIHQVLQKRTLCHIKDLMDSLPGISERTVRYDVQRLVDKGTIERVGTGGPNSFFRLLKNEPTLAKTEFKA